MPASRFRSALAGLVVLAGLALPHSASAQSVSALASYVVNLNGINVAYVDIRLNVEGAAYQLDVSADVAGLAQFVSEGSGSANSGGAVTATGLASDRFYLETRTKAERFSVQSAYRAGNATDFGVNPPLDDNANRVPIGGSDTRGVNGPLAAFILRAPALDGQVCARDLQVFTGIERFDLAMRFAEMQEATSPRTGYQGPVVLCQMDYKPISGHFTNSEITTYLADNDRMLIWYAPLGAGDFLVPYRVLIGTSVGDLSMVLTNLD